MSSSARSDPPIRDSRLPLDLLIREVRGARRLRLRVDSRRNLLTLTGPVRMNRRAALSWAIEQADWVRGQLAALPPGEPFVPGALVPVEGIDRRIDWQPERRRTVALLDESLLCGGPIEGLGRRIERFLRAGAQEKLEQETRALCERHGLRVTRISIGDAGTRWGSCSQAGAIRYNWRIIMAPPPVRHYLVAHEVAHLVHLNHGPQFRALERTLFGQDIAGPRALLRQIGPRLHRIGCGR